MDIFPRRVIDVDWLVIRLSVYRFMMIVMSTAPSVEWLIPARLVIGFASGLASVVVPVYLGEIGIVLLAIMSFYTCVNTSVCSSANLARHIRDIDSVFNGYWYFNE